MRDFRQCSVLLFACGLLAAGCGAASGLNDSSASSSSGTGGGASASSTLSSSSSSSTTASSSSGAIQFPVGSFTNCGLGLQEPDTSVFTGGAGVTSGTTITVTQQGSQLTVTQTNIQAASDTFVFEPTSDTSAVLTTGGPFGEDFDGTCNGDQAYPATVTATSGAMTYADGTLFLSLGGTIQGGAGTTCGAASASAYPWVICPTSEATLPSGLATSTADPQFPAGTYACTSLLSAYLKEGSGGSWGSTGASGTLSVTQSGATVTAAYTGDSAVQGTLSFTVTTPTTANAAPGQTILAPCSIDPGTGMGAPPPPEPLPVSTASLMMVDTTLFLLFYATVPACSGAEQIGSLVCTMM
jgi:hypothetical protein